MDDNDEDDVTPRGTVGDVMPGPLLGPVMGLAFSAGGDLLFSCSGSSLRVYDVRSGAPLIATRVFRPGVTVHGVDVGRESFGAIFGGKCVRIVDRVPTGAGDNPACSWFRGVASLPDLGDRVWDARLIGKSAK
ncbi:unnamed protein product, partial [Ectocarpus sp. 13 AM-2016]